MRIILIPDVNKPLQWFAIDFQRMNSLPEYILWWLLRASPNIRLEWLDIRSRKFIQEKAYDIYKHLRILHLNEFLLWIPHILKQFLSGVFPIEY